MRFSDEMLMAYADHLLPQMKRLQRFTERTITTMADIRAEIERARALGYAEAHEEFAVGVSGIAAPITGVDGGLLGTIGVSLPTSRCEPERLAFCHPCHRFHGISGLPRGHPSRHIAMAAAFWRRISDIVILKGAP